jgi:hypothetical protein
MAFLPFWRKAAFAAYANDTVYFYTVPLMTGKYVEVVATLQIDARIWGSNVTFDANPQISNDLVNWADVTPAFSQVPGGASFPYIEAKKITGIGWFMRFKLKLREKAVGNTGLTFSILGDGKVDHEETESREEFLASVFGPRLGGAGIMPVPVSPFVAPVSGIVPPAPAGPAAPVPPTPGAGPAPAPAAPAGWPSPPTTPAWAGPRPQAPGPTPWISPIESYIRQYYPGYYQNWYTR